MMWYKWILFFCAILSVSCSSQQKNKVNPDVVLSLLQHQQYENVANMMTEEMKKKKSKKEFIQELQNTQRKHGRLKSFSTKSLQVKPYQEGQKYRVTYRVEYERKTLFEILVLAVKGTEVFIIDYHPDLL